MAEKPGVFATESKEYPGTFSFPAPVLDMHMREYWRTAVEEAKELPRIDYAAFDAEYTAIKNLIVDWNVPNVPKADLDGQHAPAELKRRIMEAGKMYLYPFLTPAQLRVVSVIMQMV